MLVSTIITNGLALADIANTSFYTAAESLFAVQLGWEELYSFLCSNNDDYFVQPLYFTTSDACVAADANRQSMYLVDTTNSVAFPDPSTTPATSGFYRLRLIQYQGYGGTVSYNPVQKMTIENFGNTSGTPGYRFEGKYIAIYNPAEFTNFCLWYYPRPATLEVTDDLSYPYNMMPEIMSYRMALEIRRKQKDTPEGLARYQVRINELMKSMESQMSRDDSHGEPIKNQFAQGFAPYI